MGRGKMAVLLPSNSSEEKDCPNCEGVNTMHLWDYVVGDREEGLYWLCDECKYQEEYELPSSWYED